ncbi:MAG: hypothetical protein F4010_00875 [Cenarchaeum sp. SB0669_bin_11]|nr:hypothetical protein [Cenarchaeum sp. SB0669_bin_11]
MITDLFDVIWWPHLRSIAANLLFWTFFLVLTMRYALWPLFKILTGATITRDRIIFPSDRKWKHRWSALKFYLLHTVLKTEAERDRELTSELRQRDRSERRTRDFMTSFRRRAASTDDSNDVDEST